MTQRETDLPEGTDAVIPGAMDTDTSDVTGARGTRGGGARAGSRRTGSAEGSTGGSSGAGSTGGGSPQGSTGGGSSGAGSTGGGSSGNAIMDKVRSGGEKLTGQAADKARGFVGQGLERSADALSNVSRLVGDTASGLDERLGSEYGDYARRAAETIEGTANKLASKDPDELIDDTRDFIRKSPGVALAGAAIVGFALARLLKSGLSAAGEEERDRGPQSSGNPRSRS